jgi:hypothetical protein
VTLLVIEENVRIEREMLAQFASISSMHRLVALILFDTLNVHNSKLADRVFSNVSSERSDISLVKLFSNALFDNLSASLAATFISSYHLVN